MQLLLFPYGDFFCRKCMTEKAVWDYNKEQSNPAVTALLKGELMFQIPKPYEIYKHFKGNLYQILAVATHSETGEQLVIYQALYGEFQIYARPLADFVGKLDPARYPDAAQTFRFELYEKPADAAPDRKTAALTDSAAAAGQQEAEQQEEISLDPKLMEFLDADTCEKKLAILTELAPSITDDMLTTMAVACDVEVPEGSLEERFLSLRSCLSVRGKYECSRLRGR